MNRRNSRSLLPALGWILVAGSLSWNFCDWVAQGMRAVRFPYQLDYGEGIVMEQARLIMTTLAYGPIDQFPAIVFHYPPVYHVTSSIFSRFVGIDLLAAGRVVSLSATLGTAVMVGRLAYIFSGRNISDKRKYVAPITAALLFVTCLPTFRWSPLMRVDMTALFFSYLGLTFGVLAIRKQSLIFIAAICFVLGVYTKQTSIAAPTALFLTLFWYRSDLAIRGLLTSLLVGAVALGALYWVTDGGFVRHVFAYNLNRFDAQGLQLIPIVMGLHAVYFALAFATVARTFPDAIGHARRVRRDNAIERTVTTQQITTVALILHWILSALMTLTAAKSGASVNYLLEWLTSTSLLAGLALTTLGQTTTAEHGTKSRDLPLRSIVFPIAICAQTSILSAVSSSHYDVAWNTRRVSELEILSKRVKEADRPVISDDMVMLVKNDRRVLWEPAIFAELGNLGIWDETLLIDRIRRREFSMFITVGSFGSNLFEKRYNPRIAEAINDQYPMTEIIAGYTVHLPHGQ